MRFVTRQVQVEAMQYDQTNGTQMTRWVADLARESKVRSHETREAMDITIQGPGNKMTGLTVIPGGWVTYDGETFAAVTRADMESRYILLSTP